MADASLLSVLAGTDPLSPQILEALHAEQARGMVSDPANWQNQGLAGGIARTLAGFLAPSAAPQVAQIAGQRVAAQPDEARLLASADPFAEIRDHPDQYSGLARAMVLNGANPASVSEARLRAAQAALAQEQVRVTGQAGSLISNMLSQNGGVQALANAGQPNAVPTEGDNPGSLAMAQPPAVQEMVAKKIATTDGLQHWAGVDPNTGKPWNPTLRSALQQAGLPVAGPIPEELWPVASQLIQKYESYGGKNVPNYRFDSTHTAGGPFQITNSTWRAFGGPAGSLNTGPVTGIGQGGPQAPIRLAQNGAPTSLPAAPPNSAGILAGGTGLNLPPGHQYLPENGNGDVAASAVNPQQYQARLALSQAYGRALDSGFKGTIQDFVQQQGAQPAPQGQAAPGGPSPAAISAGAVPPPAQPQALGSRNYPGYPNITPANIAALGAAGAAVGRDFAKPFETLYYNSPEQKGAVAGAEAGAKAGAELPFVGPKTAAQEAEKITVSRSGAITKGGQYIGHVPLETSVVDAAGNKYPAFTPPMGSAAGSASMPQPGGAQGQAATTLPPGAVMAAPSELGPGAREALVARAKEEQDTRQQTINAGATAQMQQATLQRMAADAPNFYTGPFANHVQEAKSVLRLFNPNFNEPVASYEDFAKNAGQLVRTAVHDTSPRAAVQEFKLIGGALPNPEMSPIGLSRVLNEYMGLNDYRIAKSQAQQAWEQQHGGIGNVSGFETDWQAKASPYAFMVARMVPADRQALFSQVAGKEGGKEELQHLGQQIQYITQSGLDKFIR